MKDFVIKLRALFISNDWKPTYNEEILVKNDCILYLDDKVQPCARQSFTYDKDNVAEIIKNDFNLNSDIQHKIIAPTRLVDTNTEYHVEKYGWLLSSGKYPKGLPEFGYSGCSDATKKIAEDFVNEINDLAARDYLALRGVKQHKTPAWSGNTARDLQRVIIDSDYVDVQILYNGVPVFHFPEDFFFEYYEEIEAWGREHRMPVTVMTEGNSLLLSFSDVSSYTIQARKVPVSLSLDLKSKIRLLEENDCRYNMPIMKAKMLEYMRDNGKDPSVLDNVGLQMVITLVQVLLLQDTPEYKTLFQRDDSFLAGFNALKWMVRSDDNLYSAVMRYAFALTSIYNEYSNAKISETLQSYAIVNGTQMPILSVFSKNKSLLQFLQENKKSCKVNVEGDVMRIEKA